MAKLYKYFVEGECEEKLINVLKTPPMNKLLAGKVEVFNVVNEEFSDARLATTRPNTIIVLVYDIDHGNINILDANISKLQSLGFKNIIHVQSIKKFEDEMVYSSNLKTINDMYDTKSLKEFKAKFMSESNLCNKLNKIKFDSEKIWSRENKSKPFNKYSNKQQLKEIKRRVTNNGK